MSVRKKGIFVELMAEERSRMANLAPLSILGFLKKSFDDGGLHILLFFIYYLTNHPLHIYIAVL